jgi:hypothetical protein
LDNIGLPAKGFYSTKPKALSRINAIMLIVAIVATISKMIIIASSDGYHFGKLGCAKILPHFSALNAAWPINFGYWPDSILQ